MRGIGEVQFDRNEMAREFRKLDKSFFIPRGFTRHSKTRDIWYKDYGWSVIFVSIQKILNDRLQVGVGVHFFWAPAEGLSYDYGSGEAFRQLYTGDMSFAEYLLPYEKLIEDRYNEYRIFENVCEGKEAILTESNRMPYEIQRAMHRALVCFLTLDPSGKNFFSEYSQMEIPKWHSLYPIRVNELSKYGLFLENPEKLQHIVLQVIQEQRVYLKETYGIPINIAHTFSVVDLEKQDTCILPMLDSP